MKNIYLRLVMGLFVGLLMTATCEAQSQSLLTKIEETKLGNDQWDKVSVMLPNATYKISKVVYQDNQLVVLFNYTSKKESKPRPYTFYLSDYKIDYKKVSENDAVYVLARHADEVKAARCPPRCLEHQSSRASGIRCPHHCSF